MKCWEPASAWHYCGGSVPVSTAWPGDQCSQDPAVSRGPLWTLGKEWDNFQGCWLQSAAQKFQSQLLPLSWQVTAALTPKGQMAVLPRAR